MIYDSLFQYVERTPTQTVAKIQALVALVDAMDNAMLQIATKGGITEFQLNDGQTIIKGVYNNAAQFAAIQDNLQKRINKLKSTLNGRVSIVTDAKNMNGGWSGYN